MLGDMTALAFELAARIELYESELDALRATWSDAAGWRVASDRLRSIVAMSHQQPQLAVDIMEVARRHMELLACIADSGAAGSARRDCARQLLAAVQTLHGKCVAHFVKH
jgi:hypothetical protein